jgi:dihydrofolate reductase
MPHITAELFITLDGVVEAPQNWGDHWVPEMGAGTEQLLDSAEVMLLGRNSYLEHAGYWPTETGRMADLMNGIPKLVVSSTLRDPEWNNTTVEAGGLDAALASLGSRRVAVTGSVALVQSLIAAGALDELRLLMSPIVLGSGVRLFEGAAPVTLQLAESVPFTSGAIGLTYRLTPAG